jgi:transketolase
MGKETGMDQKIINKAADNIRILSVAMVEKAKSGHPGGAMGGADFINVLFTEFLNYDPSDMTWRNRDRFFLDPGHMSPMLYSQLALCGNFTLDDLKNFRQWDSITPGHPERHIDKGIENTSGPLGQGHAMALGAAIAERFLASKFGDAMTHKTYAFISDGGIQEEISQGVGRLAGHLGLNNFIMFYDSNNVQLSTMVNEVTSENTAKKYEAWGWNVITITGNDQNAIRSALKSANEEKKRPTLIIGNTIMGKGAVTANNENYEGKAATHGMPLSEAGASADNTIKNLGGDPTNPFVVFDDVKAYYESVKKAKIAAAASRKEAEKKWAAANPDLAAKLDKFFSGELPSIEWEKIQHKPNIASRQSSSNVLSEFAKKIENMIVSSADLSNSDKTDGFLKNSKSITAADFSGAFLQAGVAELTMAAVMNGVAAHGGVIPVCATFFTFSDYMKPAIRMAALMKLPVRYVFTHDTFRVGEDGPTHQPIEQEAQIRLLEKMDNLDGERSTLVLRPADSAETTVAWKKALEFKGPCALLLSRQNINDLPAMGQSRFADAAAGINKGGYIVYGGESAKDLVMVTNGSEVATCIDAARILEGKGIKVRVVSIPSDAVFEDQDESYKEKVLPYGVPTFGLTAGLPIVLEKLVGPLGKVVGFERFGASAPYKVLDEKFGYTGPIVAEKAEKYLKEYPSMVNRLLAAVKK